MAEPSAAIAFVGHRRAIATASTSRVVWDIEFLSSRVGERHVMGEVPTSYARASLPPASILESMDLHGHDEHKIDWQAGGQADRRQMGDGPRWDGRAWRLT